MTATASFRITTWQAKRNGLARTTYVTVADAGEAVCCAQHWVCWSNERGRPRRLPRYDRWRVDQNTETGWHTREEGTLADAKMAQPQESTPEATAGTTLAQRTIPRTVVRAGRRTISVPETKRTDRLGQLIARMRNQT